MTPTAQLVHEGDVEREAKRLFDKIRQPDRWDLDMCRLIAPMTLEIQRLKKERNAVVLAHSYQTPDIVYGAADFVGDSYGLSVKARDTKADVIVFSSVRFMAETAKIVNPGKKVLIPENNMGQLSLLIRGGFLVDAEGLNRVTGRPFTISEVEAKILSMVS